MSDNNTVYLITGANRGIGLAITSLLLSRPHATVIATSRTPAASLAALSGIHATSRLIPVLLDEAQPALTSATLPARLANGGEHGRIARVDVVIANAGGSSAVKDVLGTDPGTEMVWDFEVNAVGPAKLFRAVWPLLDPAATTTESESGGGEGKKTKKFVLISSSIGSIANLELESLPGIGYGMSKAAANWWAKKLSTGLGQGLADAIGFKEPPLTVEQSAQGVVEQVDNWTPEKSGQFLTYKGEQMPW
ncbi:hypothetical protein C8A00DRAFT_15748 [Chaetomidium leptoderma]|uniref:NAD(P)-binding protein n=1 Tax=Chaetomidium leptoderma TaxID=669021 RepID=A0AAN6VKM4_9PEZI|nr:hypothetical protein C8A00DRAFT_15748 [Chaetomidium leptoderma]